MKIVIIIALAVVLLIPSTVFAQYMGMLELRMDQEMTLHLLIKKPNTF